jgi:NADH-quinone oxidoreductase subunit M
VLSLVVFLPVLAAVVLVAVPRVSDRVARWAWLGIALVDLALLIKIWIGLDSPKPGALAYEERLQWMPSVGSSYHVGLDGLSLPLLTLTAVIFAACAVYALRENDRPRPQAALFLFLQSACLGLFAAQDLILFFVFFDLSIVGMYFVIAGWGHGHAARSALKFFLYTFLGSLALLLGFIGLYLGADPHTFDMVELAQSSSFKDDPVAGGGSCSPPSLSDSRSRHRRFHSIPGYHRLTQMPPPSAPPCWPVCC